MKKFIYLVLVLLWMGVIYLYSDMSSDKSNSESMSIVSSVVNKIDSVTNASSETQKEHHKESFVMDINHIFRKICHAVIYLALAILVFNFIIRIMHSSVIIYSIISLLVCFLYACFDEYHQTFVIGRTGTFGDVLIDMIGALVGCVFVSIIYKTVKKGR